CRGRGCRGGGGGRRCPAPATPRRRAPRRQAQAHPSPSPCCLAVSPVNGSADIYTGWRSKRKGGIKNDSTEEEGIGGIKNDSTEEEGTGGNKECFSSAGLIVSASFGCFQSIL